jgi:hypothetical protein
MANSWADPNQYNPEPTPPRRKGRSWADDAPKTPGPTPPSPSSTTGGSVFGFTIDHSATGGGIDHYMVDSNGNLIYSNTGKIVGTYDWNTGTIYSASGGFMGNLTFYNDGTMNYTTEKGASFDGSYSGSLNQPRDGINIDPGKPRTWEDGINWNDPLSSELLQYLLDAARNLPDLAERSGEQALDYYKNITNQSMGIQGFQGLLNDLGGKNMLTSSVAANSLANAQSQVSQNIADKAFTASLASTQAQMGVPGSLSSIIASLGGRRGSQTDPYSGYQYLLQLLGY